MASWPLISSIVLLVVGQCYVFGASEGPICAYLRGDKVKISTNINDNSASAIGEIQSDNKTTRCFESGHFCQAFWEEDPNNSSKITMLYQGCWESSDELPCKESECIGKTPDSNEGARKTIFCCCTGYLCNANVSVISSETEKNVDFEEVPVTPAQHYVEHATYKKETLIIVLATVFVFAVIMVAGFLAYCVWAMSHKQSPDSLHLMEASQAPTAPASPALEIENLKLEEIVGRGRYGSVWKAKLNDHEVAVKIFGALNKQYYLNECDIYSLPHMDHSSILKFIGSDERTTAEGHPEYLLVMSYATNGNLQDYLRRNVVDWPSLAKMIHSITQGLAHLHSDIRKGDVIKPCISHRDLTTRNILVQADCSCVVCDFGFSMKIAGSKYIHNGEEQHAETTSLTDVGTLRYMAPEVLEGAVNLRDCESSLKQIDIYSLGLVLWEVASRCADLYQGLEVPEYKMPYEAEIGFHPSFEQMQVLISRNKARPLFPEVWKDSNPAIRSLKETIEDCWDQDAEARLTALCVKERSGELPILWERYKAGNSIPGVSPTINQTNQSGVNCNLSTRNSTGNPSQPASQNAVSSIIPNCESTTPHNRFSTSYFLDAASGNTNRLQNRSSSSASENTMETTITMSPSEPGQNSEVVTPASGKMINTYVTNVKAPLQKVPLQPHQGRNPCIERNTMLESSDSDLIDGNTLLEKGKKFSNRDRYSGFDPDDVFDNLNITEESNTLVTNDVLQSQNALSNIISSRPYIPIPYVQNAVVTPKQPNVPGNGHSIHNNNLGDSKNSSNGFSKKRNPFSVFERLKSSRNAKGGRGGIKGFFMERKKKEKLKERKPLMKEQNINANHLHESVINRDPVATEVRITPTARSNNSNIVVRPVEQTNGVANGHIPNGSCKNAEIGVAKLNSNQNHSGQAPVFKSRHSGSHTLPRRFNRSSDSSLVEDNNLGNSLEVYQMAKRPTTLPLRGNRAKSQNGVEDVAAFSSQRNSMLANGLNSSSENIESNSIPTNKVAKRIKTPFKLKKSRFSLYDDRVMNCAASLNNLENSSTDTSNIPGKAKCINGFSTSVPLDINSLCTAEAKKLFANCNGSQIEAPRPLATEANKQVNPSTSQSFATISV